MSAWTAAIERYDAALGRLEVAIVKALGDEAYKFNPNHEPAGSSVGGQFASGEGGGGISEGDTTYHAGEATFNVNANSSVEDKATAVKSVLTKVGFNHPDRLRIATHEGPLFEKGGKQWTTGGEYDPATDEIVMYPGAFNAGQGPAIALLAHEATHHAYQKVNEALNRERSQILAIPEGPFRDEVLGPMQSGYVRGAGWFNAGGEVRPDHHADVAKHWPITAAVGNMTGLENMQLTALEKADGITPYSKAYWDDYKAGKGGYDIAVNETLAEIANRSVLKQRKGIPRIWSQTYKRLKAGYKALPKK